ncbi:MAG: penicillin-binding protein 1A [Thermodesulfobacteriota bacterium]
MSGKKVAVWLALIAGVFCGAAGGVFFAVVHDLPQIQALEDFSPSATTRVFSAEGVLITELFVEKRDPVSISQVPPWLVSALIATEDNDFFRHRGLDLKGIARALAKDLLTFDFRQGGSTLTQQLAKTLFLTSEKSLMRKIKEAVLAFQLERRYTKNEILELYLNQVYFGSGAYGVKSAARTFFNKPVEDLSLAECALIAGMPKAPSRYSPLVNRDLALWRRDLVLGQLLKNRMISEVDYQKALGEPLNLASDTPPVLQPGYFIEYIRSDLENAVGAQALYRGGLSIYTTLSWPLQQAAQDAVVRGLDGLAARMAAKGLSTKPQAALVALDVATGGVLAMVGGRDFTQSPFNRAVSARRQPGSAFKPVLYACALDHGFTPATTVLNTPAAFPGARKGDVWKPENFSKTYSSETTVWSAVVHSENLPAVRIMQQLGPAPVTAFAARLGIASPLAPYLPLALGASDVSLLEITGAYAVFPRQGKLIQPYGVIRATDSRNREIWRVSPSSRMVMPAQDTAILTSMLRSVILEGTGRAAADLACPVAGKTGTTDAFRDALFVGFSRDIAAGVWTGTDDHTTLGSGETGARAALPIWKSFMEKALELRACRDFDVPDGMVWVRVDPATGKRVGPDEEGRAMLFKAGTEPF